MQHSVGLLAGNVNWNVFTHTSSRAAILSLHEWDCPGSCRPCVSCTTFQLHIPDISTSGKQSTNRWWVLGHIDRKKRPSNIYPVVYNYTVVILCYKLLPCGSVGGQYGALLSCNKINKCNKR